MIVGIHKTCVFASKADQPSLFSKNDGLNGESAYCNPHICMVRVNNCIIAVHNMFNWILC